MGTGNAFAGRPLCLGLSKSMGKPIADLPDDLAETGWEGCFALWTPGSDMTPLARRCKALGLVLQSLHAPWNKAADLWGDDEAKGAASADEMIGCLRAAAETGAPLVVVHAWIGFEPTPATQAGIDRFGRVAAEAAALGVKVAVENTEGEEHLDALLAAFRGEPAVGFCWDTGHELCYNRGRDLMADFGDRLICTHINDNLGISDPSGPTTWLDDLHLLPFDGVADWPGIARRLAASPFRGPLTFELNKASRPGRHENDAYDAMPLRDYLAEALRRARRFAALPA
ncbi:MAG: sugar phosphate isomerase/epimerase [Kiritimatiellae bacterium]|nr:sugar phosphate isomerase/epimerase [Kiritimatiellia bacterium]